MSSRLILDLTGGDRSPFERLKGVISAQGKVKRPITLIGDIESIRHSKLAKRLSSDVHWIHAPEQIDMSESIKSLRTKTNSSIVQGCKMAGDSYKAGAPSAFISAGHSGAMMASALFQQGRLKSSERPAIVVTLPTMKDKRVILLDAGANTECEPEHLLQFALMGVHYAQFLRSGSKEPIRVALLANGEESNKGNNLVKEAHKLLAQLPFFKEFEEKALFIGNCEGKEMFRGDVDVVVTDGFTGNLVLKCAEGLETAIREIIRSEAKKSLISMAGLWLAQGVFKALKKRTDYRSVGAAPLLGVAGYTFIAHGRSDRHAIHSALIRADEALDLRFIETMESILIHSESLPEKA